MRRRLLLVVALLASALVAASGPAAEARAIGGCPMFPANNYWHADVSDLPVHARSADWVRSIGLDDGLKADFGSGRWDGGPIGIPYNIADAQTRRHTVTFRWGSESDRVPYPIGPNPRIEGGRPPGSTASGDRHLLTVDKSTCRLLELYRVRRLPDGRWRADSGAVWNLRSNALRPAGWTSADAAGLPILPGLVRWDEVAAGHIDHAIRFTAPATRDRYIWPARHQAGGNDADLPPMGAWFRLKASVDISGYPARLRVILEALQTHGMILADNGSPWYLSGVPSPNWNNDLLNSLGDDLTGRDFEAVDTTSLISDTDSGAVTP